MLEWIGLVFVALIILVVCIIAKARNEQNGIAGAAVCIIVLCFFGAMVCFIEYGSGVDVKKILNEGSTYLVKSVTYDDNKITLDLREINVATNELIGPQFLHVRETSRMSATIAVGDIIIYEDGDIGYWVSPF